MKKENILKIIHPALYFVVSQIYYFIVPSPSIKYFAGLIGIMACMTLVDILSFRQGMRGIMSKKKKKLPIREQENYRPDWQGECEVCGASPVVPLTGMCGPCTFGEADTVGGNW